MKKRHSARQVPRPRAPFGSRVAAASEVAGNATAEKGVLPLAEHTVSPRGSLEGRRRLDGAFLIECSRIQPDPRQPRRNLNTNAQKELTDSVKRLGILQPITVRPIEPDNLYQIITGERRYHAAYAVGLSEIPCWVRSPREEEVLLHQIVENWQRLDIAPYDLADALARLRNANKYSQRDLARETGKSEGEISKLLAILQLDPTAQKVAREDQTGRVTRRHLYAVHALQKFKCHSSQGILPRPAFVLKQGPLRVRGNMLRHSGYQGMESWRFIDGHELSTGCHL